MKNIYLLFFFLFNTLSCLYYPLTHQPIKPPHNFVSLCKHPHNNKEELNPFFVSLFECIAKSIGHITLSEEDLFHAHVMLHKKTIVIIFHAKEYPDDWCTWRKKKSGYKTTDHEYHERNFLWSSQDNRLYLVKAEPEDNQYTFFLTLIIPHSFKDSYDITMAKQAYTLQQDCFGTPLFDITYFAQKSFKITIK